jgi:hypothetical protein
MEQKHRAEILTLTWKDIRSDFINANPALAEIIDKLDPNNRFPIFKARYPFGASIASGGKIYLPDQKGKVVPIDSSSINPKISSSLTRRNLPIAMMLKKSMEIFYTMPDRIISRHILRKGDFLGLWGHFDAANEDYVKWPWSVVSGARSLYMLPKLTEINCHKKLRKKYDIQAHIPRTHLEHWNIFVEIANSQAFTDEWHSEMLFFSDIWIETAIKDKSWRGFYDHLLSVAWRESQYWRNKSTFDLVWEIFNNELLLKNAKPNLLLSCIVKQIILTGIGILPCLTISANDEAAPIKALQDVYINDYNLKKYLPVFMQPHLFSLDDCSPSYYSLQYPNLLETIPVSKHLPSILSVIPDLMQLIKLFREKIMEIWTDKGSPINTFCEKISCEFYHYMEEKWNGIKHTSEIMQEDERLIHLSQRYKNNQKFPDASSLISGCIKISRKTDTK